MRRTQRKSPALLRCRSLLVLLSQIGLVLGSYVCAWLLRFEFRLPDPSLLWTTAPLLIVVRLTLMPFFNLTHGWWRYTGISDALDILKATLAGSIAFLIIVRYGFGLKVFPLSIYALESLLTFTFLGGLRVLSRLLAETVRRDSASKRLLLVGAGHAAQMIILETQDADTGYRVIGCIDDDPRKAGLKIRGVPVLGPVEALAKVALQQRIDEVLIAIPSATQTEMQRLVAHCKQADAPFRTVPAMAELIAGRVTLQQAREVSLTDLLGRIPVNLDLEPVREHICGRVVMVTGAAGSICSELCRQIQICKPGLLVCLDQNETGIFHLQRQLAEADGLHSGANAGTNAGTNAEDHERAVFCVADFTNPERMRRIFLTHRVEIVFHAAAYKHVPVMEENVDEAVGNNVFGLLALLNVAESANCSAFVMISSDKAVNPTNVMGCTKRIGELLLAAWPGKQMRCVSVRFGNVLGSSGSVIPLFQEQIRQNQPITITHPDITRFFMTISEAVSLVLQAFAGSTWESRCGSRNWRKRWPASPAKTTRNSASSACGRAKNFTKNCSILTSGFRRAPAKKSPAPKASNSPGPASSTHWTSSTSPSRSATPTRFWPVCGRSCRNSLTPRRTQLQAPCLCRQPRQPRRCRKHHPRPLRGCLIQLFRQAIAPRLPLEVHCRER
jgi:FlaA1/EpsC-like NDP-sugar epimerase